ncbi:MAG: serine hydrolase domain-containing protein [Ginsengibacter sp.]
MKKILISGIIISILAGCSKDNQAFNTSVCNFPPGINTSYSKKDTVEKLLQRYANLGVPGVVMAVYSPEGYWGTSKGFSKIETKSPMELCQLQYLQSASKTYMAVSILKLYEEGKIDLDAPITTYLPEKYRKYIDKAASIKVRNLLNHTSGVPEYTDVPEYITYLLQHPFHSFTSEEFLGYIKDKKLQFTPGSKFVYTNTNFHLLALIADAVADNHATLIQQKILTPLGLTNTFYRNDPGYLHYPTLVNSYLDRYSNGVVENVSNMQQVSVACSKGDDGIVATPLDAINFLRGLMEGKLLKNSTMQQMMTWVNDEDGQPVYGLGIYNVRYSGQTGYGHGGAGIGAGCGIYYFPGKSLYVFVGTNIGTLIDGPIVKKVEELKRKLLDVILKD